MEAGKFKLDGLVTHEFKLDRINEAIAVVKSGDAGRVLVAME
jgi:Zn-dependent alcohol dehydrogenase